MQHCISIMPQTIYKGMRNIVRLKFSVGDTIAGFTITIDQDN